jgi:hypothetical protein
LGIGSKAGHRTIDYYQARNQVTFSMASEHPWERVWYGNTDPRLQCGDRSPSWAIGDGYVDYIFSWPMDRPPSDPCGRDGVGGGGSCCGTTC